MRIAFAAIVLMFLQACSLLPLTTQEQISKYARLSADKYCAQPYELRRDVTRPEVNKAIAPHKVKLDCYGDPDNPATPASK